MVMQVGGDAFLGTSGRCVGEDRWGCCVVKAPSDRAEPWPAEERADRGTAFRGDGSENVIMRCRCGSSPEVASGGAWAVAQRNLIVAEQYAFLGACLSISRFCWLVKGESDSAWGHE